MQIDIHKTKNILLPPPLVKDDLTTKKNLNTKVETKIKKNVRKKKYNEIQTYRSLVFHLKTFAFIIIYHFQMIAHKLFDFS